jgi:predicted RNA-binding Zn ribbon-like protein
VVTQSLPRPEPFFVAGAAGIDFLNSIATPVDTPVEWLASGRDLLDWLCKAGLVPAPAATAFRRNARRRELDAVAAQARALREWFRAFIHVHRGKPLRPKALAELEPLNVLLARDREFRRIALGSPAALRLVRERQWDSPETLLLPIAAAIADVICDEDFANIKACEGNPCSLIYVDRTGTHTRRWCSMAVCGNRHKQATHRQRKR